MQIYKQKITVVSWAGTGKGGKKQTKVLESYEIIDVLWDEDHAEEGEDDGMWVAACVEIGHGDRQSFSRNGRMRILKRVSRYKRSVAIVFQEKI